MWKKILAGVLVIVGLALVFSNQLHDLYLSERQKAMAEETSKIDKEQMKKNLESEDNIITKVMVTNTEITSTTAATQTTIATEPSNASNSSNSSNSSNTSNTDIFDFSQVENISLNKSVEDIINAKAANKDFAKKYIIGILKVPSIELDIAVLKGVLNDNLLLGSGTLRKDQRMGQGNYPIAGHVTNKDGLLFNRIPKIKKGDYIYLTDKDKIYVYEAYDLLNVDEKRMDMIEDEKAVEAGNPIVSLFTCDIVENTNHRIFVLGKLVKIESYSDEKFNNLKVRNEDVTNSNSSNSSKSE